MHSTIRKPPAARMSRALLLATTGMLIAACAQDAPVAPDARGGLYLQEAPFTGEVIVQDEEWIDRTIEETPVPLYGGEAAGGGDAPSMNLVGTSSIGAEPRIRVGVVYQDFNATFIRMSGQTDSDPFELRDGGSTGAVIASGLTGEVGATIVGSGATAIIRLTLPGGGTYNSPRPVALISESGVVRIRRFVSDASRYRGNAEVGFNAARSRLVGINELPIEQYLYGVVPRELGPNAFPFVEAQKTQAVAARTFARRRMQYCGAARCGHGYHVVPTTSDQVYGGLNAEHALSTQAVDDTRGVVATYAGALIEGLYSSTSGGWTANSEDVYLNALPYLRGLPDAERGEALAHVPTLEVFRRHGNPTNLRAAAEGDAESDWSAYHRWYVSWSLEEMRQVAGRVRSNTFIDPGVVYSVNVVRRADQGRVLELQIATEKRGTLTARKDSVRSALRYVTYNTAGAMVLNSLRSTLVFVEPVFDPSTKALVGWEAWGGGWGHGVGMSQTGAVGMAEKGRTYQEILGHYYQGVTLEQRWD